MSVLSLNGLQGKAWCFSYSFFFLSSCFILLIMRTLGIKASADGLFLVARSDLTLYVVNPLTGQFKSLPQIYPHTRGHIKFLNTLIVHGTAEMQAQSNTGHYAIYLFGNCPGYIQIAQYRSFTGLWTVKVIYLFSIFRHVDPLHFRSSPSLLWSYSNSDGITCFSATCEYFHYFKINPENIFSYFILPRVANIDIPNTIELEYCYGETCYNHSALPILLPHNSEVILVGRVKRNDNDQSQRYGRLPIVRHGDMCLWEFNEGRRQWSIIDIITTESLENMIKSSEGTDFLAVGDNVDNIWLMLRGSESMVHYKLGTREWRLETGCPGGGYVDANFHWKATFNVLKFNAKVSFQF